MDAVVSRTSTVPTHASHALGKLPALDGIRGVAVLAVMFHHFERFVPASGLLAQIKSIAGYGWVGVELFFALSGFLITGILLRTRTTQNYFSSFYGRRTLRIFPIYYATLIVVFAGAGFFPTGLDRVPATADRWLYFAFLTNWIGVWRNDWPPNVVGHFWTLAVEEQFYLAWPLCVLFFTRRGLWRVAIVLSVFAFTVRCLYLATGNGTGEVGIEFSTVTRMDSLLIGALAAILYLRHQEGEVKIPCLRWWIVVPLVAFAAGILLAPIPMRFVQSIGYSLLAIGFSALVLASALGEHAHGLFQRTLRTRVLQLIGKYSYGMYVYHVPVLGLCELLIFRQISSSLMSSPAFGIFYVFFLSIMTFTVAALSYELVEKRVLNLKRYVEPRV